MMIYKIFSNKIRQVIFALCCLHALGLLWLPTALAQSNDSKNSEEISVSPPEQSHETDTETPSPPSADENTNSPPKLSNEPPQVPTEEPSSPVNRQLELQAQIAQAEAQKTQAEAQIAQAEAEIAKAEAQKAKANADAQKANAEAEEKSQSDLPPEHPNHHGFYARFTPGIGIGRIQSNSTLDPLPGIERIDKPSHRTSVGSLGIDLGGGFENIGLHVGAFFEKMIFRDHSPTLIAYNLFGLNAGVTWYFTKYGLYLTGQARWLKMLVKFPSVACSEYFIDTYEWYDGPGMSLWFGKEWYDHGNDEDAVGLGLQGNYYRLKGGIEDHIKFNYVSLLLVVTFTHF